MSFSRSSGILLHPTSLPGKFGIGDLGVEAYQFIDFLAAAGQSLWQVLPLGPTGYGDSPYQCFSAFAGNPLLVSPQRLFEDGLLMKEDVEKVPIFPVDHVDFGPVIQFKTDLLRRAYVNFKRSVSSKLQKAFEEFCSKASAWLDDYALYSALKDTHGGAAWNTWEQNLVKRESSALISECKRLSGQIEAKKFYQFLFFKQWQELKAYCNKQGIKIVGDIPIFVSYDSADVWTHPDLFKLDKSGNMTSVAGVPPDYFSKTGQLWGNPLYNWKRMRATGYEWWIKRMRSLLEMVDIVRLDHFRGFIGCWEVPAGDKTAANGRWVKVPGRDLFANLKRVFGELPIIAEDLGVITPEVEALRDDNGFPGMHILQFAFSGDSANANLPHNYIRNMVIYTGTHDNDTTVGWFNSVSGVGSTRNTGQIKRERMFCLKYLNSGGKEIHWDFIRTVLASIADIAIIPLQDVLGIGSEARMNLPASQKGNWGWRLTPDALTWKTADRLKEMCDLYGRPPVIESEDETANGKDQK